MQEVLTRYLVQVCELSYELESVTTNWDSFHFPTSSINIFHLQAFDILWLL